MLLIPGKKRTSATKGFTSAIDGNSMIAVRIINIMAENFHINDKLRNGKKIGYKIKQGIDKEFEFTEAMRTDDLKAIVENINQCNRHSYRMKFGKEPPCNYIEMKVNDNYFDEMMSIQCPACGHILQYKDSDRPMRVKCPSCGKEGIIR